MNACEDLIVSWSGFEDYKLGLFKLDWSTRRTSSRGGIYHNAPGINIAMNVAVKPTKIVARAYEYASFDRDKVIGGFYYTDTNLKLGHHICHEMAHTVQFYSRSVLGLGDFDKPHGKSFKTPYRAIRQKILNPLLEPQQELQEQYNKIMKRYNR